MRCDEVKDRLLEADDAAGLVAADAEVRAHVESCAACAAVVQRLAALEQAVRGRATPAMAEAAGQRFLAKLAEQAAGGAGLARRERSWWRHGGVRFAIAASWLLAIGITGVVLFRGDIPAKSNAAPEIVDGIVDWNLDLTEAESEPQKSEIYEKRAAEFEKKLPAVPAEERPIAEALLQQGKWLAKNDDPVDAAGRFNDIQAMLLDRLNRAIARNDTATVQRLTNQYARIADRGVTTNIVRGQRAVSMKPDLTPAMQKLIDQDAQLRQKLEAFLERVPDATRQEIIQQLNLRPLLRKQAQAAAAAAAAATRPAPAAAPATRPAPKVKTPATPKKDTSHNPII